MAALYQVMEGIDDGRYLVIDDGDKIQRPANW